MRITDALLGEHRAMSRLLDHVDRCAATWNLEQAREGAASLAVVLRPHAEAEEELLFRTLERVLGHEPVPLAVLRLEYEEIGAILDRVAAAESIDELRPQLGRLVRLVSDHFAKEEGIIFPLASSRLDRETLNRLGSRWASPSEAKPR